MNLYLWRERGVFSLEFQPGLLNVLLTVSYIMLLSYALWRRRADFQRMSKQTWVILGAILLSMIPTHSLFILYRDTVGLPVAAGGMLPTTPAIPLVGFALVAAAATWLGPGPGIVAHLFSGVLWAWFYPVTYVDLLAASFWGYAIGVCLYQPYKGEPFDLLRQPLIAFPLSAIFAVFLLSVGRLANNLPSEELLVVEYILAIWSAEFPVWLLATLILGGLFQLIFLNVEWRPTQRADVVSIYSSSLRARFMFISLPLVLLSILLSVLSVTGRAIDLAREQSLDEMRRSAENASEGIAHFYYTGSNLLSTFVDDPTLLDPASRMHILEVDYQVVPFFHELLLVSPERQIIAAVPDPLGEVVFQGLTVEELMAVEQALEFGISQVTRLTQLPSGLNGLTVVQPIGDELPPDGFMLGRVRLDVNPEMSRALDALQLTRGSGTGFILDERGLIIAHPEPTLVLRPWDENTTPSRYETLSGTAYEDVVEGQRVLVFIDDVAGTPYRIVLQLPFSAVLDTAATISSPLLVVQVVMGMILLVAIPLLSTRITQPLNTLVDASNLIAAGDLSVPVDISGEDEVARLGNAFEKMRLNLQARLNDLSLLLSVAQSVSATLDLERGVPLILEGALEETGSVVARFVLLGGADRSQRVFSVGAVDVSFEELDRGFAKVLMRRQEPLIIRDLIRAKGSVSTIGNLHSVAAFPVRAQNSTAAILWVGANVEDAFDEARINFLSTLANQAAVLVENARLFQAAEGGRRRLAAILASTTDAILVTDSESRLLLINPAAQHVLSISESAHRQSLEDLVIPDVLLTALTRVAATHVDESQEMPAIEVPMEDGRTFYASIAPIIGTEGLTMGQVVVLRDVTHFKELDEMKSEFVATVSHDLRAPLTFIRGYATMLMMVGELNDKQHEYLQRILEGIDQMSALIGDLLNLRRIEAGVGIRQEPCRLGLILVESVDTMRARATTKGVTLRLEPAEGAPTVIGDRTLLRQAVSNLVDNAIKYTSAGGQVSVGLDVKDQEAHIHISDTGIGIAPEDQVRLFEKFYRIKRRETGNIQGTGLGLALVKSIVERHGGQVWVESVLDQGSTFYIALPISEDT
ncbi:MAG: HAMP domain-containing protein [Anaerolineae bacterium]|nr:HAMP domain-containing protein [Anaerolineae bacterium]